MKRRSFIQLLASATALGPLASATGNINRESTGPHIAVIGAGAFGGWTAMHLLSMGARVTLLDAWGPGHSRASSGGETRVIRQSYGDRIYIDMVKRSLALWQAFQADIGQQLYHRTGLLFMGSGEAKTTLEQIYQQLRQAKIQSQHVAIQELAKRYPQISQTDLEYAIYEPEAGYLLAKQACLTVRKAFVDGGGNYQTVSATPAQIQNRMLKGIKLSNGQTISADRYVFACGPWLRSLFPDLLTDKLKITRQEVFYFGIPANNPDLRIEQLPIWADFGDRLWYGIPGNDRYGFKLADDTRGPDFNPGRGNRIVSNQGLEMAQNYLAKRFPGLHDAPLIDSRVCQYSNTPDGDFILDKHPEADNIWLAGGGSGHGYKHGPALGQMLAQMVLNQAPTEPRFSLSRFE